MSVNFAGYVMYLQIIPTVCEFAIVTNICILQRAPNQNITIKERV